MKATDYPGAPNPLDTLVRKAARATDPRRPVLVWITNSADPKDETTATRRILSHEKTICALQRFVCLKGDTSLIPDDMGRREAVARAPLFYFFDPAGNLVDSLQNKRALSRPLFAARLGKTWQVSYAMPIATYLEKRDRLLDALDDIAVLQRDLRARIDVAAENTRRHAVLREEEKRLIEKEERLQAEEWRLIEGADLREKFFDAAPQTVEREPRRSSGSIRTGTRR